MLDPVATEHALQVIRFRSEHRGNKECAEYLSEHGYSAKAVPRDLKLPDTELLLLRVRCSLFSEDYEQDDGHLILTTGHVCFVPLDNWVDLTEESHVAIKLRNIQFIRREKASRGRFPSLEIAAATKMSASFVLTFTNFDTDSTRDAAYATVARATETQTGKKIATANDVAGGWVEDRRMFGLPDDEVPHGKWACDLEMIPLSDGDLVMAKGLLQVATRFLCFTDYKPERTMLVVKLTEVIASEKRALRRLTSAFGREVVPGYHVMHHGMP